MAEDVKGFAVGDEVHSMVNFPSGLAGESRAYAEYVGVPSSQIARVERGYVFYAFALEDAPSGRMLLTQRWLDQDAFTAHLAGPHAALFQ